MSNEVKRESINTLNDLMAQLQQEIQDVKGGITDNQTARVVLGIRKAQLKTAEIGLAYQRLMKPKNPTMDGTEGVPLLPIPQRDEVQRIPEPSGESWNSTPRTAAASR